MFSIDLWFVFICKFSLVVLVMLVPGALALRFIKQPIERIRLIQISLLVALTAAFLAQTDWRPKIEIPVLTAAAAPQADMSSPVEMITRESSVVLHQDQGTRTIQPNMDPAARVNGFA